MTPQVKKDFRVEKGEKEDHDMGMTIESLLIKKKARAAVF